MLLPVSLASEAAMLKGKTALVTGSTSGIGLGIAEALAKRGANIVLNGFGDKAEIERLRVRLTESCKVSVAYDGADLSKPDAIEAMLKPVLGRFGAVDILVNNAGIQHVAPVEEFPRSEEHTSELQSHHDLVCRLLLEKKKLILDIWT